MEADVTFHATKAQAATQAGVLRGHGLKVALAGPVDQIALRNQGGLPNGTVSDRPWIVLAVEAESGLVLLD